MIPLPPGSPTPRASSDLSVSPGNADDREALSMWKFTDVGARLARFEHLAPAEPALPPAQVLQVDERARLCQEIAEEAKRAQNEFVFSKQQCDLLANERDFLKWRKASEWKAEKLSTLQLENVRSANEELLEKLKKIEEDIISIAREQEYWNSRADEVEADGVIVKEAYEAKQAVLVEWMSKRGVFVNGMTAKRRAADKERVYRNRQLKKLDRAHKLEVALQVRAESQQLDPVPVLDETLGFRRVEYERAKQFLGELEEPTPSP